MENHDIPNYSARKAALIEEIIAAFDGVSREGGVSLSEAKVIDDYGSEQKRAAARLSDTDTRWQDVPDEDVRSYWDLHFFDPIGFRYYLPCFLLAYLHYENLDEENGGGHEVFNSNNFSSLDSHFAAGYSKAGIDETYRAKFEALTPAQSRAVAHFLEFEAERADAWTAEMEQFHLTLPEEERPQKSDLTIEEWEQFDRELFSNRGTLPEDLERLIGGLKRVRIETDSPDNEYRYALERYWGRFL